jgi:3',5'-cyclic AMP phosphodiesterase CpdA
MRRDAMRKVLSALLATLLAAAAVVAFSSDPERVRFAVIGDGGTGDRHQHLVAQRMSEWHERLPFALVLMLGDNIYGGLWGLRGGGHRRFFEKQFDEPYAALLARGVVFRASIGNHDARTRDGRDLIEDHKRFGMDSDEGYYRFAAGRQPAQAGAIGSGGDDGAPLVEFFALNTDRLVERRQDPDQLAWLEKSLAASRARWRIVYGHNPLYSTGKRHGGDEALRAILEPILLGTEGQGGSSPRVQVFLAGHDHIYERLKPQKGIVHFVCGSSGKLRRGDARRTPEVAAAEDQLRAFMLWEATPDGLTFRAINEEGNAFDCGRISSGGAVETVACSALPGNP